MKDARQKKVLTVLVIGLVILAWRVYAIVTTYGPAAAHAVSDVGTPATALRAAVESAWIELPEEALLAQAAAEQQPWGRDPFLVKVAPVVTQTVAEPQPAPSIEPPTAPKIKKISGVSRSNDRWLAAIDGRIYRVGDTFAEKFVISEITSNSVTLTASGWAFEFALGGHEPKVRSPGATEPTSRP
jgi:hypothetical protein